MYFWIYNICKSQINGNNRTKDGRERKCPVVRFLYCKSSIILFEGRL